MENNSYLPIVVLLLGAVGFAAAPLALAWVWARKFSPPKPGTFEERCVRMWAGGRPAMRGCSSIPATTFMQVIFLVFDVEAVFLLPFATAFYAPGAG